MSVRKYCQLFTYESNTLLGEQYVILPIQTKTTQMPKNPRNSPFPLHVDPIYNTSMPWPTPLTTPNDSSIGSHTSTQPCNKVSISYNGMPKFTPKMPLPFDDHYPHLIHSSLDRPHLPSQTASRSTQPFCHSTLSRQTDRPTHKHRPTDGLGNRSIT